MRSAWLVLSFAGLISFAGCAAVVDTAAATTALQKRDAEWAEVASAGKDIEKIVSYWSDDAVVVPPGQARVTGKEAIRAFVTTSLQTPGFKIRWVSEKPKFSPDGKLAYMQATNETTIPGPSGGPMTIPGRSVTVWRLESDGEWRCVMDIWNDPPIVAAIGKDAR